MLKIWAHLDTDGKILHTVNIQSEKSDTRTALLDCLEQACRHFDIEMPMWQSKHTKQLKNFRKIYFTAEDFVDAFPFGRFVFDIIDNK